MRSQKEKESKLEARTITEASNAIEGGCFNDKGEEIINEGVQSLVSQHAPGQVGHRLELVVDEELRSHSNKTWKENLDTVALFSQIKMVDHISAQFDALAVRIKYDAKLKSDILLFDHTKKLQD